jgi:hypothetical protein
MPHHPDDDTHVAGCARCQARASLEGLDVNLEKVWMGVAAEVWARPVGRLERWAASILGPGLARALVTTPSLVLSWILATAAVLAVGVLFTESTDQPWVALLAPALAGIGIAYAYGPGVDPAFELSQTMAISDRMVLVVRGLAVFGVNAVLGLLASHLTAQAAGLTLYWLLPMTTVAAMALAAAALARSANVGVAAALSGWAIIVLGSAVDTRDLSAAVTEGALMPFYALGTAVFVALALWATSSTRTGGPIWR